MKAGIFGLTTSVLLVGGWVEISKMERIKGRGIDIGSKMVLAFNTKRLAKLSVKSILVAVAKVMYLAI